MGNSDSLTDPMRFRSLIPTSCRPARHLQGSPVLFPCGLPYVSPLLLRESICRLRQFTLGQVFPPSPSVHWAGNSYRLTKLHIGSLSLQPVSLRGSLTKPLSRNLTL